MHMDKLDARTTIRSIMINNKKTNSKTSVLCLINMSVDSYACCNIHFNIPRQLVNNAATMFEKTIYTVVQQLPHIFPSQFASYTYIIFISYLHTHQL